MQQFQNALSELKSQNRYRSLNLPAGIDLTSNDYMGMAVHPALRAVAIEALEDGLDIGAAGSRLLRGHTQVHADLERYAATYFGAGGALYFSSGFQANYALFTTLPDRRDVVLYDGLIHASVRDGLIATQAKSYKFAHNDMDALEALLKRHRDKAGHIWIAVESVYSMDGDVAPLADLYGLAVRYDATLIVDEAHATGIYGADGKGLCWDIINAHGYDHLVTLHTCGKAIGVAGGLVCASVDVIEYMVNKARPFIFSTAPMPLQALLVRKSLEILASDDGAQRRKKLFKICALGKDLFGGAGTQVIPIMLGEDARAVEVANAMQTAGYDIRAIRPPTVPQGQSRLRLSLSSQLESSILQGFADALQPYMEG
ncbi:MAG: 8-amino-7-oxononanoate synthase [Zetaproteobacteria bacterium]|nr:MAG: 8-amino-7-oxononanoate synthase [Zetaproteobacteria bacterium]